MPSRLFAQMFQTLYGQTAAALYAKAAGQNAQARQLYNASADLSLVSAATCFTAPSAIRAPSFDRCAGAVRCVSVEEVKKDSGVLAPTGYFDPAGLMSTQEQIDSSYKHFKEVEIKHGRVAMLAAVGFIIAESFHPLFGGNIDAPSFMAFQQTPLQKFWPVVVLAIGAFEYATSIPAFESPVDGDASTNWKIRDEHISGDAGLFGGKKLAETDPAKFKAIQTKEINNGRLAMLGIAGMVAQELVTGGKLF